MDKQHPQQQWQQAVIAYAQAVNDYVAQGRAHGWDNLEEPQAPATEHLLDAWLAALQAANRPGMDEPQRQAFREAWPPAHHPLIPLLEDHGQGISHVLLLEDDSLLARIGMPYDKGQVVRIDHHGVTPIIGIEHFGRCPARRYFALANAEGVRVTDGWGGPQVQRLAWPTGLEGLPPGYPFEPFDLPPTPTALIPFPDGQRVLLVSAEGIFVLATQGATRLLPQQTRVLDELAEGTDPDDISLGLSMEHGAVSADGRLIVVGEQGSRHLVLDERLKPLAHIGPGSEYPHFALFNRAGDQLIVNACHFYSGATLAVRVADLHGLNTDYYSQDPRTPLVQDGARVYAGVARDGEYIVGDAYGYLRAFGEEGTEHWQHYLGSTISAMDISADGQTLVAASHAGVISVIALDSGRPEWQIGTGAHGEVRRWLFWKSWDKPMAW
ncbi:MULTISPECIES: hypothetical protein [Pseudomonas]|uniref:hypothetical protein n=1 Tax=Pseudomonas TaxID=286 RepID=UPI00076108DE|nr:MULTISPECIES: hypothetical protein [Pseudomonas]MDN5518658.1 hypothetical protein [Pseudomonas sp.]MDN5532499.1 hypothetical protein [Pseudomonas sp.]OUS81490.1 hypothetical protein CBP05_15085 [Pseudomonas putida]OUS87120.1 hypothetical protein CBP06_13140 [Pseudomonas putida]